MLGLNIGDLLIRIIAVIICLTVHEAAHAWMANVLGDKTATYKGRATFNPLAHIDPVGLLMLIIFGFGWAKPVPVNMLRLKNPRRDGALIALAGPVSNFILAFLFLLIVAFSFALPINNIMLSSLQNVLLDISSISIGLGVFNLLPVPPLDGSHLVVPFLPRKWQYNIYKNMQFIQFGLIILLFLDFLNPVLYFFNSVVSNALLQGAFMISSFFLGLF